MALEQPQPSFHEAKVGATAIRDLGLTIAGTRLEPILVDFERELAEKGIHKLRPRFYLSTEWGVPEGSIAIAIPFYLARNELTQLHAQRTGHVEGYSRRDILRYLRHEMGHVVNYAYRLFEDREWVCCFGSMTQPYVETYRPEPFSRRFVRHLPGWYAQKHPDEDWAETFAVWMTPGRSWREEYTDWAEALTKLEFCDRTLAAVADRDPMVTEAELDEDVADLDYSIDDFYQSLDLGDAEPRGLDGALRAIFEDLEEGAEPRPASKLIARVEQDLVANVFRWTGHFPEKTRLLLHHLARRADACALSYRADGEEAAVIALTTLVTALAMNHVHKGSYLP
jgi:hypothetical protein